VGHVARKGEKKEPLGIGEVISQTFRLILENLVVRVWTESKSQFVGSCERVMKYQVL
jgi:hypothetical protein